MQFRIHNKFISKSALTKCKFCVSIIDHLLQKMQLLESKLEDAVLITCNSTDQVNDLKKDIDLQLKNHSYFSLYFFEFILESEQDL